MSKIAFLKEGTRLFLIGVVSLTLTLIFSQVSFSGSVRGVTDTTIKIGAILDQTGPAAGDITLPATEGFRNYMRHVNDNPSSWPNVQNRLYFVFCESMYVVISSSYAQGSLKIHL